MFETNIIVVLWFSVNIQSCIEAKKYCSVTTIKIPASLKYYYKDPTPTIMCTKINRHKSSLSFAGAVCVCELLASSQQQSAVLILQQNILLFPIQSQFSHRLCVEASHFQMAGLRCSLSWLCAPTVGEIQGFMREIDRI